MPPQTCSICKEPAEVRGSGSGNDNSHVSCDRCGEYEITHMLLATWKDSERAELAPALSGLCRELHETEQEYPTLTTTNLTELVSRFPVPNMEDLDGKLEKLLAAVKRKSGNFGQLVELSGGRDNPLAYAKNDEEFFAFVDQLLAMGLLGSKGADSGTRFVTLTAEGWKRFSRISAGQKLKQAFVAISFDPTMDESQAAIISAIEECGFRAICIKNEYFNDMILDKALGEIRRSQFVVIDLTNLRPSVFYEAGFAKALGVEAIYVYREGAPENSQKLEEFYVKHYQYYKYKTPEDLRGIVVDAIRARIKS